jgi:hypothetical protein
MNMPRPSLENLLFPMSVISALCLFVLVGLFFYSGSLLPATQGADQSDTTQIWIIWGLLVGFPLATSGLWIIKLAWRRGT